MSSALFGSFRRLLCSTAPERIVRPSMCRCREYGHIKLAHLQYTVHNNQKESANSSDDICLFLLDILTLWPAYVINFCTRMLICYEEKDELHQYDMKKG